MSDHPLVSRVPGSKRPDNKCIQGHLKPLAPELLCNASVLLQLLSTLIPQGLVAVFEGNGNINNRYTPNHSVHPNQVGTKIKLRAVRDPPVHSHLPRIIWQCSGKTRKHGIMTPSPSHTLPCAVV